MMSRVSFAIQFSGEQESPFAVLYLSFCIKECAVYSSAYQIPGVLKKAKREFTGLTVSCTSCKVFVVSR